MNVSWPIVFLGVFWWYLETSFFGWNSQPESVAELFADGLALVFFGASVAVGNRKKAAQDVTVNFVRREADHDL